MEKKYHNSKFVSFIKKNIYYLLMIACIIAIGTLITIAALNNANDRDPNVIVNTPPPTNSPGSNEEPNNEPVVFTIPVEGAEIGMDYSMEVLLYHSTLNQYMVHRGIDFLATEGTEVVAAYDGVVQSIETDPLNGTTIVIMHEDNMQTVYSSLDEEVNVILNQAVNKGDVIGSVSNSSLVEFNEGPHLHFEVKVNNENVDPNEYLPLEYK
jgi:murein DD-endopeptidase MepM/ murein hydrolase activator NlpD